MLCTMTFAESTVFLVPLRFVALTDRGAAIDGVTVQCIGDPKLAVLVFDDRASAKRTVSQFLLRNPGKGLPIVATGAKDSRAEPEMALAVFENGVNVIRAVFRIGEFVPRQCRSIAGFGFGER